MIIRPKTTGTRIHLNRSIMKLYRLTKILLSTHKRRLCRDQAKLCQLITPISLYRSIRPSVLSFTHQLVSIVRPTMTKLCRRLWARGNQQLSYRFQPYHLHHHQATRNQIHRTRRQRPKTRILTRRKSIRTRRVNGQRQRVPEVVPVEVAVKTVARVIRPLSIEAIHQVAH